MDFRARQFFNGRSGEPPGDPPCAVCGLSVGDAITMGDIVSENFTNWDLISGDRSSPCCPSCQSVFKDFKHRGKALIVTAEGCIEAGPDDYRAAIERGGAQVLTYPSTRKKHCWLNAGVSDDETLRIGGDDHQIVAGRQDLTDGIVLVERLFAAGATKTEVKAGIYRPATLRAIGHEIEQIESSLRPLRFSGALDVAVWCTERVKGQKGDDMPVLNDADRRAAHYLALLANGSAQRDADAIGFWGRGFLTRLNRRVGSRSILQMTEALAADLSVRSVALRQCLDWLDSLPDGQAGEILERLRASPRVMIALAQDAARQIRGPAEPKLAKAAAKSATPSPFDEGDKVDDLFV